MLHRGRGVSFGIVNMLLFSIYAIDSSEEMVGLRFNHLRHYLSDLIFDYSNFKHLF